MALSTSAFPADSALPDSPVRTALVGEWPAEGEQIVQELAARGLLQITNYQRLTESLQPVNSAPPAELVLVSQSWSDQYSPVQVEELLAKFPLARIVCVYQALCEADGRTRSVWYPALRVPAWKLRERLELEIAILRKALGQLPLTATREEIFQFEMSGLNSQQQREPPFAASFLSRPAMILTPDFAWGELLRTVWRQKGQQDSHACNDRTEFDNWLGDQPDSSAVIIDLDPLSQSWVDWARNRHNLLENHQLLLTSYAAEPGAARLFAAHPAVRCLNKLHLLPLLRGDAS